MPRTVAVVGAGPTGLALALMLARQGRRVVVHEQFDEPRPIGAGFMLQPTGLHVLDRLGLTDRVKALGQPLEHIFGREARRRRVVLDVSYADLKSPRPDGVNANPSQRRGVVLMETSPLARVKQNGLILQGSCG